MYKLNEEKCFYDLSDGQAIVINFTNGIYYGFGELGSVVLDRLLKGCNEDKILSALLKIYGISKGIEKEFNNFVEELLAKEIIVVTDENSVGGDEEIVGIKDFVIKVEEFAEVQDLILADPIHEVDVTKGWPALKPENE